MFIQMAVRASWASFNMPYTYNVLTVYNCHDVSPGSFTGCTLFKSASLVYGAIRPKCLFIYVDV